MVRRIFWLVPVVLAALGSQAQAVSVQDVVGQVSGDSYRDILDNHLYTHTGDNRGYSTLAPTLSPVGQHNDARDYIYNQFASYGLPASLEPFTYTVGTFTYTGANNVLAVKPGTVHPEQVFIIGSHYDSVYNPGADDNASGVAGVLEAARILSQYQFESTIVFAAFDLEEKGLFGSNYYVQDHPGQQIMGMIQLDMIAYNPEGDNHDKAFIYGRTSSDPTKQSLAQALSTYGGLLYEIDGDLPYSDHAAFEAAGYPAALLIEYSHGANPYYHSSADSVDTAGYIDYAYATDMTRGAVGWLADEAVLTPEPATLAILAIGAAAVLARRRRRLD
jgi:Zn-dependent M28 family amino/carboxypeptidase